jgi:hypothetical protein
VDTYFELNGCSGRALLRLCLWREELGKELIFALLQHHLQVNEQSVGVLVEEASDVVVDITGIMHDSEAVLALLDIGDLEVLVTSTVLVQLVEQCLVAGIGEDTFFVQKREDATALNQTSLALITNNSECDTYSLNQFDARLVVEVLDRLPWNTFSDVLFLFGLECQFNEDLLQFLVHVVDAKLFKAVLLEDFKAVNVQDTNVVLGGRIEDVLVDAHDNVIEQATVHVLGECITSVGCLNECQSGTR